MKRRKKNHLSFIRHAEMNEEREKKKGERKSYAMKSRVHKMSPQANVVLNPRNNSKMENVLLKYSAANIYIL